MISTRSFSAAPLSSSTWYKPTLAMGIRSSGTLAQGVGRAGAMRWLQFKKGYFLAFNILYNTFFFKLYNDKSLQVHFQRHLDSNECVLGNELPYVCETCGKGILLVCLNSFSCFMLFMFSFLTKNTPGWFNLTNYTRHVESRECKVCFQSYPFCPTSDFNLVLFVTLLISINPICPTSDLIVPNWYIPESDFRSWRTLATSTNA